MKLIRWQGPAQHVHFFYTFYHLSAPQNEHANFSSNFWIIFIFELPSTQFNLWILYCANFQKQISQFWCKIRACFVSLFLYFPKSTAHIFNSQKSSKTLRESLCRPSDNRGQIKIWYISKYSTYVLNFIISKFYHNLIINQLWPTCWSHGLQPR